MTKFENLKALIVEDDEVHQIVVQKLLDSKGIGSVTVNNATDAWDALKTKEFNFILMDIKMPQHDGLEAVQWIRDESDNYYKDIPIFAVSSFASPGYIQQTIKAGMNEHLTKPLDINKLMECLEKYFPN
jgi:two-component system, sensor histidine kinase and response regulator